ncbi:MAG: hypothetical protein A2X13_09485 [Bacteroidetes bacterium GWC2_33_15]|nr:MAG: hypothetical protein A2X10_10890 [Bacteroidetes bacterium GWA2_33_15]OFX48935.1 MAG: hypothetical protein A2X13_09485 [Bacteroidetes bacterium GWC2_33_15]OFX64801.1 MAG: hypothetical protein A2X15_05730 [Bacteroidetes bacterium GWB2_32_14]OFX68503.1 MAG: hypothetical protein A2X14_15285 [Bacteroidetes bacterium GWD2_33_33]HAN19231.1 hypothetical protein [Bacteroidales bacterium]
MKLKIKHKIQIYILLTTVVIYAGALGYISINSKQMAFNDAKRISDNYAFRAAKHIQTYLGCNITTLKDLSNSFKVYKEIDEKSRRHVLSEIMKKTLESNADFFSVWCTWEPNTIDNLDYMHVNKQGSTVLGNFAPMYYKQNNIIKLDESVESNPNSVFNGEYYQLPKKLKKEVVLDPYFYSYSKNKNDEVFEVTICAPIIVDNQFLGVVGIDIMLDHFQEIVNNIKPFDNSIAFLMSNNGTYVANPDKKYTGRRAIDVFPDEIKKYKVMEHVEKGDFLSYEVIGLDGSIYYDVYAPIEIGDTDTPWSVGIAVPISQVMNKANRNFKVSIIVGILGLLILSFVIYTISNSITRPILKITHFLNRLSKGQIDDKMNITIQSGDEIEEMGIALNKSIKGLLEKTEFAQNIGNGNLNTDIHLLSDEDVLGKSLIDMRNNLKKAQEEEAVRKVEDEKRRWTNEGLALFSDVLRKNHENITNLGYEIIQTLINYLKANQGGLFIINDEQKDNIYFELLASYAYNRKKYKQKIIHLGEGLAGACALEKATIFLTELPDDYIQITSGLGGANPKNLLIVPLKVEENVLGIIEIASFNTIQPHEIEFVEKVGQNIASTLVSVKINERTARLLNQSKQQSEELAAQEEEMRQNMEELQATQEEATRKTTEMQGILNALDLTSYIIEYNLEGTITSINNAYLNLLGIRREEAIGKHHSDNIKFTDEQKKHYDEFWRDLRNGKVKKEKTQVVFGNKKYLFMESYTPIYDENGTIYKILKIANDISEYM